MGYDIPEVKIEQLDDKNLTFLAVGSTEDEDRDKDIVRVDGWKLQNFMKNPVLPWSHNYYELPVGKAISIKKDKVKKKLIFKPQFDANDEKARMIFSKYQNGFLNTFSVGFMGLEFSWRDEENRWYGGREFTKQELLEISPVTVPANPNANMDCRGINDDLPPTLAAQGYKQFTCKMDSGLFVPVTDTEIYTSPAILQMTKGIKGIYGVAIDNPEAEKELIGYLFNSDMDEKEAGKWVNDNGFTIGKVKYFDMGEKQIGEEEFELEMVEEEIELNKGLENEETDENEELEEELEMEEKNKEVENTEVKEEKIETEEVEEKEEKEENEVLNENISLTPKEINIDELAEKVFDKVKELLTTSKILVEKEEEIDNNENVDSEIELEEETEESKNGEMIEFDASLLSPVSEEKNSEDFIEVDDKVFEEVKSQMKANAKSTLCEALEKSIKQVMQDFSGKLDD